MRNTISVDIDGNEFSSALNDGTNTLVINDVEIDSSEWVGSGYYTTTVNGYTLSIAKVLSLVGNVILVQDTAYNYSLLRTSGMQPGLLDTIYPVGSIYMSVNAVNPSILFGGVWEQIKDRFLLAAGDTYSNASTGGEVTHLLTASESGQKALTISGGSHIHSGLRRSVFGSGSTAGFVSGAATQSDVSAAQVTVNNDASTGATGTHTHSVSAENAASAHNNMPPYLVVNIWKRTG